MATKFPLVPSPKAEEYGHKDNTQCSNEDADGEGKGIIRCDSLLRQFGVREFFSVCFCAHSTDLI